MVKLQHQNEEEKMKIIDKKQYSKMLLSIVNGRLQLFTLKKKDEVNLKECEVRLDNRLGLSENNKYMFELDYKVKGLLSTKLKKQTLGTDTEVSRLDWVFSIQLSRNFHSRIRDSACYVNDLKKISIL